MKGKTRLIILSAAVLTALVCVGAAFAAPKPEGKAESPMQDIAAADEQEQSVPTPQDDAKYTVTAYQGRLAVYLTAQMDTPQYITDVEVSTLPKADREALSDGIPIYTEEQLTSILEDYSS